MSREDPLDHFLSELSLSEGTQAITHSLAWLGAFAITQDGIIIAANEAFCALMEQDLKSLLGVPALDVVVADEQASMEARLSRNDTSAYTLKLVMPSGTVKLVAVTPHLITLDGKTCRLAAFSDMSEYVALKDVNEHYHKVFSAAGIGIARVNLDGSWLECNEKLCELSGYSEEELLAISFQDMTHPDELNTDAPYIKEMLAGSRTNYTTEKRYRHKQGHYIWARLTVTLVKDSAGIPQYFVSLIQDITAEKESHAAAKRLNEALENLSLTDGLTGIGNRRMFDAALKNEWRRAQRDKTSVALILADIDHFKQFNDRLGHLAGDDCLKKIARTLQKRAKRVSDCVARYGGEEFVILLPGVSLRNALNIAEECRTAVESLGISRDDNDPASRTTISLGVAEVRPAQENAPEVLIDAADHKLYEAKDSGRNRVMPRPES